MAALRSWFKKALPPSSVLTAVATGAFANDDTNAIVTRDDALCYCPVLNFEYMAEYQASDGQLRVHRRTPGGAWSTQVATTPVPGITDDHKVISVSVDGAGCLMVAWGMHSTAQTVWVASTPGDFAVTPAGVLPLPLAPGQAGIEAFATYPVFRRLSTGNVVYLWRTGGSGNGNQCVYLWDYVARAFSAVNTALFNGEGTRSAYLNRVWIDVCDRISWAWQWREDNFVSSAHDCNMAYTEDVFSTVRAMDGTQLPTSITATNAPAALAQVIPQGPAVFYEAAQAFCCDAGRRGIAVNYYDANDGHGVQLHATRYTGSGYVTTQFGTYPPAATAISRPLAIFHKGCLFVFFALSDAGVELGTYCFFSRNEDLSDVQQLAIDATPIKDSSVCMSMTAWRFLGEMQVYNQRTTLSGSIPSNGPNLLSIELSP